MNNPVQPHQVEVPAWISNSALKKMLESVAASTGKTAELVTMRFVFTESIKVAQSLSVLFSIDPNGEKPKELPKPKKRRNLPAWSLESTGESFSTQSLNKRLKNHALPIGSILHHPREGRMKVVAGETPESPDVLIPFVGT